MDKKEILIHFKRKQVFNAKNFDTVCLEAHNYAVEHGFTKDELFLLVEYCLSQKLTSRRVGYMIKMLIPETYVPDDVIREILKYLLANKNLGKEASKAIFQWLIGLTEQKLTESDIINRYYDIFFQYLKFDDSLAAKLIYLLTKPQDVKRWYVKKVLKYHEKFGSKPSGALLYLFKTYRPDFVPENIPAYAAQTVFPKLPAYMVEGFSAARERIEKTDEEKVDDDNICWERTDNFRKRGANIILIPRTLVVDDRLNINVKETSLKNIRNIKQLHKYMLGNYSLENVYLMQLLNNSAGRYILAMADNKIHTTMSYIIYSILCDSFYNPRIQYEEMKYFLQCIGSLQTELQQCIPIISHALVQYITNWDSEDYFDDILNILEFVSFNSYEDLYEQFLVPLRLIFMTCNLEKKCDILNTIGNMILNFIMLHCLETKELTPLMFPNQQPKLNFIETVANLLEFAMEISKLGLYLEKNHCLIQHSILNLYDKIASIKIKSIKWKIPDDIVYSILFSNSSSNIISVFNMHEKFHCISDRVMSDFNLLKAQDSKISMLKLCEEMSRDEIDSIKNLNVPNNFYITRHLTFSSYFISLKFMKNCSYGMGKIVQLFNKESSANQNESQKKKKKIRLGG